MHIAYTIFDTVIGQALLAESRRGVVNLAFGLDAFDRLTAFVRKWFPGQQIIPTIVHGLDQIEEFLAGSRREFNLPLDLQGTEFQKEVWQVMREIPYGQRWSYSQVALKIGRPKSSRAVGQACGANPVPLIVPCHRVMAADGGLGGFGLGLDMKKWLLALEEKTGIPANV